MKNFGINASIFALGAFFLALSLFSIGWGYQHFRLWAVEYSGQRTEIERQYQGKAILAEAEYSRQTRVEQARAELESAEMTAKAIRVVGEAAREFPEYRNQEFILSFGEALRDGTINQIIYVPTEASIPITEAGHR
jgi:hypothetical protein